MVLVQKKISKNVDPPKKTNYAFLWYWCNYPIRSRDTVSPVCGIFNIFINTFFIIISFYWPVTPDTWQLTPDTCHETCDVCHLIHRGLWTLFKHFRYLNLTVWERRSLEDIFTKDPWVSDLINKLMSDKGVCRTAPATQGLLISKLMSDKGVCRTAPAPVKDSRSYGGRY